MQTNNRPGLSNGRSSDAAIRNIAVGNSRRSVTFLPEPARRERWQLLISADDHVVEPAHLFEGRVPRALADRAPRIVETDTGDQEWVYEGSRQSQMGLSAVAGRPISECTNEPTRFEHMRRGAWDPTARVADMDTDGVYASVNFASALCGFAGQRLQLGVDAVLGLAVVRAWNSWFLEEWSGSHPDRFIPCQLPWLGDPDVAASEIRANAARGYKAVAFTEGPHELGLPSLHSGHWDPFFEACEETGTVVCLHVGSSSTIPTTAPDAPGDTIAALFFGYSMFFTVDWLFSQVAIRFPGLRIVMAEGGLGWVPGLMDRLVHMERYQQIFGSWDRRGPTPLEVLRRNFYFCVIEDAMTLQIADSVGVNRILVESDYPHLDSTWPDTQPVMWGQLGRLAPDAREAIAWRNAAALFRHEVAPAQVDAFLT